MKKLIASILILLPLLLMAAPVAFALEADIKDSSHFDVFDILSPNKDAETSASAIETAADEKETSPARVIILKAINILMLTIGTFAFVLIVIGGFLFATSGGDEPKIDRAKAILTQSVIGLVIAFGSYLIVYFIQSFFYY